MALSALRFGVAVLFQVLLMVYWMVGLVACIAAVWGTVVWIIAILARHTLALFLSITLNDWTVW